VVLDKTIAYFFHSAMVKVAVHQWLGTLI